MFGKCRLKLELWFQVEIFLLCYLETHTRVLYLKTDGNNHMNTPCGWFSVSINLQLRRLVRASAIIGRRENKNGEDQIFSLIQCGFIHSDIKRTEFESSSNGWGLKKSYREATIFQIRIAYFFRVGILTGSYECIQTS